MVCREYSFLGEGTNWCTFPAVERKREKSDNFFKVCKTCSNSLKFVHSAEGPNVCSIIVCTASNSRIIKGPSSKMVLSTAFVADRVLVLCVGFSEAWSLFLQTTRCSWVNSLMGGNSGFGLLGILGFEADSRYVSQRDLVYGYVVSQAISS